MQYLGLDWAYRRAAWCAVGDGGAISGEGVVSGDEDGLARLVLAVGVEVRACVEMMSGAVWVRDRLAAAADASGADARVGAEPDLWSAEAVGIAGVAQAPARA